MFLLNMLYYQFCESFWHLNQVCCSLEIQPSEVLGQVSEQGWGSDGINLTSLQDIEVLPSVFPSVECWVIEPGGGFSAALLEMGAKNLLGDSMGFGLSDVEFTAWLWVFLSLRVSRIILSLKGVVLDKVLGEFINWDNIFLSSVSLESLWENSFIRLDIVSIVILGSWELVHVRFPSSVNIGASGVLEDLLGLDEGIILKSHFSVKLMLVQSVEVVRADGSNQSKGGNSFHIL